MVNDFLVKLVAQHDYVLHFAKWRFISRKARAPHLSLTHEIETGAVKNGGSLGLCISTKENRRAKDPLKCPDQSPILRSALLHAEGVQHVGGICKCDRAALLTNGQCSQKNRHKAILTPRNAITWVASHLEDEPAVPPLMEQATRRRPFNRKTAKDEGARNESHVLLGTVSFQPDASNRFGLAQFPLGDDQVSECLL